jgi:solute carrier family 8 (sodium/calcium exchanger)
VVSILGIGMLTAVIGDVASHFGCTVGVKDAVTAVTFVALGTSVPGKRRRNAYTQRIYGILFE